MATLLIRNVPAEVHAALQSQAERNRRSKEKQALFLIEAGLRVRKPLKEVLADAAKVRAQTKGTVTLREILSYTETEH
jgi:plasmid stability protein